MSSNVSLSVVLAHASCVSDAARLMHARVLCTPPRSIGVVFCFYVSVSRVDFYSFSYHIGVPLACQARLVPPLAPRQLTS